MKLKRLFFCKHEHVRCIHGDEVWQTMRAFHKFSLARVRCIDCGRALYKRPLLEICSYTGRSHSVKPTRN